MTRTIAAPSAAFTELAAVLATGYLRLARKAPDCASFRPKEPPVSLDSPRDRSAPVVQGMGP